MAVPERGPLAVAVALGLVIAATRVGQGVALAYGLGAILRDGQWGGLLPWLGLALGMVAIRGVAIAVQGSAMAGASVRITTRLRVRLVSAILALGPRWLSRERSGELEAVLVDGVERLDGYFRLFLARVISAALSATAIVATVIVIDPPTGACVAVFAAVVVFLPAGEYRALGPRMRFWSDSYRPLTAEFVDSLQGMTTLKMLGAAIGRGRELEIRSAGQGRGDPAHFRLWRLQRDHDHGRRGRSRRGPDRGRVPARRRRTGHSGAAADLAAGRGVLPSRTRNPRRHALRRMGNVQGRACLRDPAGRPARRRRHRRAAGGPAVPAVTFEDVIFGYGPGEPVLAGVSFTAAAGQSLAIVGSSGAGKTTIASLLLRFYDPSSGRIRIGGTDIAALDPDAVRELIAVVPQDAFLFHASIRDNLAIASRDADDGRLRQALAAAGADAFVTALPDGLGTVVGERGLRLSGGQRQRIAIARALLKDAPVLILDEATSSVDVAAESSILAALEPLRRGRTTLLIAHRLSTVRDADQILVLDHGRIAEAGSHQQLMDSGGRYARLLAAQAAS